MCHSRSNGVSLINIEDKGIPQNESGELKRVRIGRWSLLIGEGEVG